eukprot:symbB.v1.2.020515.t1/scaffold1680.1/size106110/3
MQVHYQPQFASATALSAGAPEAAPDLSVTTSISRWRHDEKPRQGPIHLAKLAMWMKYLVNIQELQVQQVEKAVKDLAESAELERICCKGGGDGKATIASS